jgi:hypothetical protein
VHLYSTYVGPAGIGNTEDLDASHRSGIGGDVIKRMVCVARNPEPMENDGKFSQRGISLGGKTYFLDTTKRLTADNTSPT